MKLLRFACVALLTGAMVVACGDDEAVTPVALVPTTPAPIFGSVSGTVSVEGSGLPGVSVNLLGAASQAATTGSSGGYSFGNVPAGTHGVQISGAPADVAFVSTTSVVTIATSGQTATADFSGNYIRTSSITGSVTAGGVGVVATVTATGAGMLMSVQAVAGSSNTDGDFTLSGLRAGTYHVAISDFGDIDFPVTTRDVTVGVGLSAEVSFSAPGEGPISNAFLSISSVTDGSPDNATYSGLVTTTVEVERGDARFKKITLYVDNKEVTSQSFGPPSAPAEDAELAAAQQVPFTLSFDSGDYVETGEETGAVTYSNGAHKIFVGLTVEGSTEEAYSNQLDVEFDNEDGVHVAVSAWTQPPVIGQDGGYWYGGDAGFDLTAFPVTYSGRPVPSVTLLEGFCGKNDGIPDEEAPYIFTPDCGGYEGPVDPNKFTIGAIPVTTLNAKDEVFFIKVDYKAPSAPTFSANPNKRENGWINGATDLLGAQKTSNKDGWLNQGEDGGVGTYTPLLRYGPASSDKVVDGAIATDPLDTNPEFAESTKKNNLCFVATARDLLGNESSRPKAGKACVTAAAYALALATRAEELEADPNADDPTAIPAGLLAGVDLEMPTAVFSRPTKAENNRTSLTDFQISVADEVSDINQANPVELAVEVRNADGSDDIDLVKDEPTYYNFADLPAALPLVKTTTALTKKKGVAYYTLTAQARDQAGNLSSPAIMRTALYDVDEPTAAISVGLYDGGSYPLTITFTDDLSVRDYRVQAEYSAAITLGTVIAGTSVTATSILRAGGRVAVDAYDAATLTDSDLVQPEVPAYLYLQGVDADDGAVAVLTATDGDLTDANNHLDMIEVEVRDQSGKSISDRDAPRLPDLELTDGFRAACGATVADPEEAGEFLAADKDCFDIFRIFIEEDDGLTMVKLDVDDGDVVELKAIVAGVGDFKATTASVAADDDATPPVVAVAAAPGEHGLTDNPLDRVDFYATVVIGDGDDDDTNNPVVLRFIASAPGFGAFVETENEEDGTVSDGDETLDEAVRIFNYSVDVDAAEFRAIVGTDDNDNYVGRIVAFAVKNDDGVALLSAAAAQTLTIEP